MNFSKTLLATLLAVALPSFADQLTAAPGGAISAGMAGVSQAVAVDASALVGNPATLTLFGEGLRADLSVGAVNRTVEASRLGATDTMNNGGATASDISLIYKKNSWAVGFSYSDPGNDKTEWNKNDVPVKTIGHEVKSEVNLARMTLAAAYNVNDKLTAGIAIQQLSSSIRPGAAIETIVMQGSTVADAVKLEALTYKVGATYAVSSTLRVGASYQPSVEFADSSYGVYWANQFGEGGAEGHIRNFKLPAVTSVGVAWQASDRVLVAADYEQVGWKDVANRASFELKPDFMSSYFFSTGLTKDQGVLRVGGAWKYKPNLTLRGGMVITDNPVDSRYHTPVMFTNSAAQNGYTLGATYEIDKKQSVSVAYRSSKGDEFKSRDGVVFSGASSSMLVGYSLKF